MLLKNEPALAVELYKELAHFLLWTIAFDDYRSQFREREKPFAFLGGHDDSSRAFER